MSRKLIKMVGLGLLAVLMAVPLLGGCGGEKEKVRKIVIGVLGDQTGPSALANSEVIGKGLKDYLRMIEETDPIPGVKLEIVTYDTRLEFARVPIGYEWLKGKGARLLVHWVPQFNAMTARDQARDKIPSFTFTMITEALKEEWAFSLSVTPYLEMEAAMDYILGTWNYQARPGGPVVGYLGESGRPVCIEQLQGLKDVAQAKPHKPYQIKDAAVPGGTTAFAGEVQRLKDCDIIVFGTTGPSSAAFLRDLGERGYQGMVIGATNAVLGLWTLIKTAVPGEHLDGLRVMHAQLLFTDESTWVDEIEQALLRYRPGEAGTLKRGTTYMSGYEFGLILTDVVRRAVAAVGAENVDGTALRQALETIDITTPGRGEALKCHGGERLLYRMFRLVEYRLAEDDWFAITDWFLPPSLA